MTLDDFLKEVDGITTAAETEIVTKKVRVEVTALHAKYLGARGRLQEALRSFAPTNDTDGELSKHAVKNAKNKISDTCIKRITEITREENAA